MTRGKLLFRGGQSARRRIKGVTDDNAKQQKQKQDTATSDQAGGGRRHTVGLHVCEQPPGAVGLGGGRELKVVMWSEKRWSGRRETWS
jgi:hypothetical protein